MLQSGAIDLAVAPVVGVAALPSLGYGGTFVAQAQLPMLVGVHLSDSLTLLPQLAAGAIRLDERPVAPSLGYSLGLSWQLGSSFALQPAVSAQHVLNDDHPILLGAGLGFDFGPQP